MLYFQKKLANWQKYKLFYANSVEKTCYVYYLCYCFGGYL